MSLFRKKYEVKPNTTGFLYRNHQYEKTLQAGIYKFWDMNNETHVYILPNTPKLLTITNQEVLTKDNVALRFSFNVWYAVADGKKFLDSFALDRSLEEVWYEAENKIHTIVQLDLRNRIAALDSESVNEHRMDFSDFKTKEMEEEIAQFGIRIEQANLRDLTFPRNIQQLFAKHLEAKIRAKSDLENARTTVATARALKNAADLMKDHENIKFFQLLETYTKIAENGKHTFVLGDLNDWTKKTD